MKYGLVGFLILVLAPGLTLGAAILAARVTARRLGVPAFRLGTPSTRQTFSTHCAARSASVGVAFLAAFALSFAAAQAAGTLHPTMAVTVYEGPAREAGVKDGDVIVAVDGKDCKTFEALKNELRTRSGPRALTLERGGERITVVVTPTVDRRIGVEERLERRPSTVGEATASAFRTALSPLLYLGSQVRLALGAEKATLSGPVGIVRDVSRGRSGAFGAVLAMAALLTSFVWPLVAAVHAVDAFLCRPRRRDGGDP